MSGGSPKATENFTTLGLVLHLLLWMQTASLNLTNLVARWNPITMMVMSRRGLWMMMSYMMKLLWDHHITTYINSLFQCKTFKRTTNDHHNNYTG
jgi:hypothetical protein